MQQTVSGFGKCTYLVHRVHAREVGDAEKQNRSARRDRAILLARRVDVLRFYIKESVSVVWANSVVCAEVILPSDTSMHRGNALFWYEYGQKVCVGFGKGPRPYLVP